MGDLLGKDPILPRPAVLTPGTGITSISGLARGGSLGPLPSPGLAPRVPKRKAASVGILRGVHALYGGHHLLVDCYEAPRELCLDDQRLLETLADAAKAAGATVISQVRYRFGADSPPGCTALVMLDESHCSVHTYADPGLLAFDFFTCGDTDARQVWEFVRDRLGLQQAEVREVPRFGRARAGALAAGTRES